ncbi:GntR family transcriptional regulator [Streptomyces kaniharaensis]|uniref:GntR family transcriptional regulator n=1 Tax=Streptomyces kaniharaensis TaxID=212423 RepID=A0A6N7KPZ7_9ACTN|nr:GntR family transcriptional regulator [Streptomyces kaniharaensis]MQS12204.1 GntR family transcriptional regulator [Streptomyces kaniharaensis]
MAIIRNEALHKQVAAAMRQSIATGEWPPGTQLPTETDLAEKYGVSRPTVRLAVAALRSEGLLDVKQGRGTFVRTTVHGPASAMERTVTVRGSQYETPADAWFGQGEEPTVYRTRTDAITGPLLGMDEGEAMFGCDRLITDPNGDGRALHRLLLPMEHVTGTPLAKEPGVTPTEAYAMLVAAGHNLAWRERVSARIPQPDERQALRLSEAAVLLVVHRVTYDQAAGLPLILEETRLGAETAALAYEIEAAKPKRATRAAKATR